MQRNRGREAVGVTAGYIRIADTAPNVVVGMSRQVRRGLAPMHAVELLNRVAKIVATAPAPDNDTLKSLLGEGLQGCKN